MVRVFAAARRPRTILVLGLVCTFLVSGATPSSARPVAKLAPRTGVLLGAYIDPDARWRGNDAAMAETTAFERAIGRNLSINMHFYAWGDTFPSGLEQWDIENGRTPLVSWEATRLSGILAGSYDAMIKRRADALKALGAPVFLRWGHEMNGNWYAWDGVHNNDRGKTNGPAKYRAAWKRIHSLFRSRGATNVVFVWAPNHVSVPNTSWNSWRNYYPGDAYVDWVGIDAYNWGTSRSYSRWTYISTLIKPVYRDYAGRKPIMLAETASADAGGSKAGWINNMRRYVRGSFPSVAAVMWFHVKKENDWRANSTSTALSAFKAMANDPYYAR
jgi:hypothetical protein